MKKKMQFDAEIVAYIATAMVFWYNRAMKAEAELKAIKTEDK